MEKIVELFGILDDKYHFSEEDVELINKTLYGSEEDDLSYGDKYVEEDEYTEDEEE